MPLACGYRADQCRQVSSGNIKPRGDEISTGDAGAFRKVDPIYDDSAQRRPEMIRTGNSLSREVARVAVALISHASSVVGMLVDAGKSVSLGKPVCAFHLQRVNACNYW